MSCIHCLFENRLVSGFDVSIAAALGKYNKAFDDHVATIHSCLNVDDEKDLLAYRLISLNSWYLHNMQFAQYLASWQRGVPCIAYISTPTFRAPKLLHAYTLLEN